MPGGPINMMTEMELSADLKKNKKKLAIKAWDVLGWYWAILTSIPAKDFFNVRCAC